MTVVRPGPPTTTLTLLNTTTGDTYRRPVGNSNDTGGGGGSRSGGEFVATSIGDAGYQAKFSTSADGTKWAVAPEQQQPFGTGLAFANGKWLALSSRSGITSIFASVDLRTWTIVQDVPAGLDDLAYGAGRWIAVGGESDPEIGHAVIYSSADGRAWTRAGAIEQSPGLESVAYGHGTWIAVDNGHQGGDHSGTYRSTDGTHWTLQRNVGLAQQAESHIAYASGHWMLGGSVISSSQPDNPDGVVSLSTDGNTWTAVRHTPFARNAVTGVAYGNGEWLVVTQNGDVFSSADAWTWTKRSNLHGGAFDLTFGGGSTTSPPAVPVPTTVPTTVTAQPASSLKHVDWNNFTYTDQVCSTHGPMKFTNKIWYQPGTKGTFSECSMRLTAVEYADVTGDGVQDAIVNLHGSTSGVALGQSDWTTVFTTSPSGPVNHGYFYGSSFPPYSASSGVTVWIPHPIGTDADCCPREYEEVVYKYSAGGTFTKTTTIDVPTIYFTTRSATRPSAGR